MSESTDPVRAALAIPVRTDGLARLDGRVAVVTGTSSGLGQRFARVLDAAGASVVLASRRHQADTELAATLSDALAIRCDVHNAADRKALVAAATERFGRIDILVNNAGIAHSEPAETEAGRTGTQTAGNQPGQPVRTQPARRTRHAHPRAASSSTSPHPPP